MTTVVTEPTNNRTEICAEDLLASAQLQIAEVFGNIADFWGFTRTQGRIFGLVFLSPVPLDQRTIRDTLAISAGSASMTVTSLVEWGVLRRVGRKLEAETDFWKLITTVIRRREREEVEDAIDQARGVMEALNRGPDTQELRFAKTRLAHLLRFFETGMSLLEAVISLAPINPILQAIARGAARYTGARPRRGRKTWSASRDSEPTTPPSPIKEPHA